MMSPTYFEIVAQIHERLPYSFLTQIFFQLDVVEKEYMKFDVGRIMNWESMLLGLKHGFYTLFQIGFSSVGGTWKGVYEAKLGNEFCG